MTNYPTFTQHFTAQALTDHLPFGIDFKITPVTSDVSKEVSGFNFPVLNDLTTRESWFFEVVEELNGNRKDELTLVSAKLAALAAKALGITEAMPALNALFSPTADQLANEDFLAIYTDNKADIEKLTELLKLTQSTNSVNWLRVTFFILSRCNPDWTLGDTTCLTNKQVKSILDFIATEANGGVEIEDVEETTEEPTDDEEKKQ